MNYCILKTWLSRVPAIVLALVAVFLSVSAPVKAISAVRTGETEIVEIDEAKFVQQKTCHSRRHKRTPHREHHFFKPVDDEPVIVVLPEDAPAPPYCFWSSTPPLLRAPPALVS